MITINLGTAVSTTRRRVMRIMIMMTGWMTTTMMMMMMMVGGSYRVGAALQNFPARKQKKKFWFHVGNILGTKFCEPAEPQHIPPPP
jgi:hypothetical protein